MSIDDFSMLDRENADYSARKAFIGIFLKAHSSDPHFPNHVGLIYVDDTNKTRAFHYVITNIIVNEELIKPNAQQLKAYFHAPLPLDPDDAIGLAAILAGSRSQDWLIRYSMNWPDGAGSFSKVTLSDGSDSLEYGFAPGEGGLTCATFVAEVLAGLGHEVVKWESWPPNRPEDLEYRTARLEVYKNTPTTAISLERIAEMGAQDPFYRLRPEEIAAAATRPPVEEWPVEYEDVETLAIEVLKRFAQDSAQ